MTTQQTATQTALLQDLPASAGAAPECRPEAVRSPAAMLSVSIFIEPHERFEALAAYADRLTCEQVVQIDDAPESALINLRIRDGASELIIIEEG